MKHSPRDQCALNGADRGDGEDHATTCTALMQRKWAGVIRCAGMVERAADVGCEPSQAAPDAAAQ